MHLRCRLRHLREAQGMSINEAERQTGISKGTLSAIERGKALPLDKHVEPIERVYGAPAKDWWDPGVALEIQRGDEAA